MKIVDRKTFLQMPEGTVFCKIGKNDCFISEPCVKHEPLCGNDFFNTGISDFMFGNGSDDFTEAIFAMQQDPTKEYEMELWGGRDGYFEGSEIRFLIFSKSEVQQMIELLQEALKNGYGDIG